MAEQRGEEAAGLLWGCGATVSCYPQALTVLGKGSGGVGWGVVVLEPGQGPADFPLILMGHAAEREV